MRDRKGWRLNKMEPIISPEWLYLVHVLNTIWGLSFFTLFISVFGVVVSPLIADCACGDYEEQRKIMHKIVKICAVIAVISLVLLVFIPDKKTMYAMIAASVITPDNISITEDHIADLVSKIAEAVHETK